MKTVLIPLVGDIKENLYQLGLKEAPSFRELEERVVSLLSTNSFLRYGQDIISRARMILKKKEESFFQECIDAYAEGLGIESSRYASFLSLFELAAHYGQIYPELKGLLPGCTSLFEKTDDGITHTRLLDFPLLHFFEEKPRLYYWQIEGKPSVMNYSCEGLAPLFFQAIHGSGFSVSLHHKPGEHYHRDGNSIFKIIFDTLFNASDFSNYRKEIRKNQTVTKWGCLALDNTGMVLVTDLDGPSCNNESFNLNEISPLIFTNIPILSDVSGFDHYIQFSHQRQTWLKEKLEKSPKGHRLDLLTDVSDQKIHKWVHPCATLSTVGAYTVNLTKGEVDVKEGSSAIVASDPIIRFSLSSQSPGIIIKKGTPQNDFESGWKRAALAQSFFDQAKWDEAYHELQMAISIIPHPVWKEILNFYLCLWDFKFVSGTRELQLVYKKCKKLKLPSSLQEQWLFLCMRLEKKLDLVPTVTAQDVPEGSRELFLREKTAPKALFQTWMKLLYPRIEILDVFSPHHK